MSCSLEDELRTTKLELGATKQKLSVLDAVLSHLVASRVLTMEMRLELEARFHAVDDEETCAPSTPKKRQQARQIEPCTPPKRHRTNSSSVSDCLATSDTASSLYPIHATAKPSPLMGVAEEESEEEMLARAIALSLQCAPKEVRDQSTNTTQMVDSDNRMMQRLTSHFSPRDHTGDPRTGGAACSFGMLFSDAAFGVFDSRNWQCMLRSFFSKPADFAFIMAPFIEGAVLLDLIKVANTKQMQFNVISRRSTLEELRETNFGESVKFHIASTFHFKVFALVNKDEVEILQASANPTASHVQSEGRMAYNADSYAFLTHCWDSFEHIYLGNIQPIQEFI
jgi:hypothetical protein